MTTAVYVPAPRQAGLLDLMCRGMLLLTMALCVVVPHSFQVVTAAILVATFLLCVLALRRSDWLDRLILFYCAGLFVTAIYIWVGYAHGATREAVNQTAIVYMAAPLIWLVVSAALVQLFGLERAVRWFLIYTWLALASVAAFFFAVLTIGKQAVSFLTEDANVNVSEGFAGANMLVYGSLIFLAGAYFAEPGIMRSRIGKLVFPAALVLCAITSGRSALILAIPVGYLVGVVLRRGLAVPETASERRPTSILASFGLGLIATFVAAGILAVFFPRVDLIVLLANFWNKLISGGGDVRTEQIAALWEGVEQSYGLGVGHGIGVRYLRSDIFPWRYEVIPLASMLRVGIFGTAVYVAPFVAYCALLLQRFRRKLLYREDVYMAGGFLGAALAAFTNPYIESFIFQWMYFLPVVSLGLSRPAALLTHRPEAAGYRE